MSEELKPFDLERAKAGEPICYANRFPCTYHDTLPDGRIVVSYRRVELQDVWGADALLPSVLRMLPRKVKRWHVIGKGEGFPDESAACKYLRQYADRATIIEHEWEE